MFQELFEYCPFIVSFFFPPMFKPKKKKKRERRERSLKENELDQKNHFVFVFQSMNNTISSGHHALLFFINLLTLNFVLSPRHTKTGSLWTSENDEGQDTIRVHSAKVCDPIILHSPQDLWTAHVKVQLQLYVPRQTQSWRVTLPAKGRTHTKWCPRPSSLRSQQDLTSVTFKYSLSHAYAPAQLDYLFLFLSL